MKTSAAFRTDLNGLRGIAVLGVLGFHFGIPGFGGGFTGVDAFFVLSGYLMTAILVEGLRDSGFSFGAFYSARSRRTLPALAATAAAVLGVGYFVLTAGEYAELGRHGVAAMALASNVVFWRETGYFDGPGHTAMLLHTWSLALEWQFYLLYPVCLAVVVRFRDGRYLRHGLYAAFAASLLLCVLATPTMPAGSFFLLPARLWEHLAGALVFLHARDRVPDVRLTAIGLALLAASFLFLDAGTPFPGQAALLPVAGTVLVLIGRFPGPLLENPVLQFTGTISYSLYLWHWPLVVLARLHGVPPGAPLILGLLAASFLLALVSYYAIERPLRRRSAWVGVGGVALAGVAAFAIVGSGGWPARLPEAARIAEDERLNRNPRMYECFDPTGREPPKVEGCAFAKSTLEKGVVLLGDSHALALFSAVETGAAQGGRGYFKSGCPPLLGIGDAACKRFNAEVLPRVLRSGNADHAILAARWSLYSEGFLIEEAGTPAVIAVHSASEYRKAFVATACAFRDAGIRAHFVAPIPEFGHDVPRALARVTMRPSAYSEPRVERAAYARRNAGALAALEAARTECGAVILDPVPYLCDASTCPATRHGTSLYYDDDHLSEHGNRLVVPLFREALQAPPAR